MLFDTLRAFDRLESVFDTALDGMTAMSAPMDLRRDGSRYVLEADLPGVEPDSIDVTVDGRWLTVRAERSSSTEGERGEWLVRERTSSQVVRRVTLMQDVDVEQIAANYRHGVLTVTIPLMGSARPRKIAVEPGSAPRALGTQQTVQVQEKAHAEADRSTAESESAEGKAPAAHSSAS